MDIEKIKGLAAEAKKAVDRAAKAQAEAASDFDHDIVNALWREARRKHDAVIIALVDALNDSKAAGGRAADR